MEEIFLDDRKYIIYAGCGKPEKIIFLFADKNEEQSVNMIYSNVCRMYVPNQRENASNYKEWLLVVCLIDDWNRELSPWKAPAIFGNEDFAGEGAETLSNLTEHCIPYIIEKYNINIEKCRLFTAGYSLAGLFSLWALHQSYIFSGAISCSGSLWFNGFEDYVKNNRLNKNSIVYISLGDKEHKTKNPIMSTVKAKTEQIYSLYENMSEVECVKLEWNEGNHFNNPSGRLEKGILWMLRNG